MGLAILMAIEQSYCTKYVSFFKYKLGGCVSHYQSKNFCVLNLIKTSCTVCIYHLFYKSLLYTGRFKLQVAGQCRSVQVSAGQCRSVQVSAGQCRLVQVSAGQCRLVQVSAGQCRLMQVKLHMVLP